MLSNPNGATPGPRAGLRLEAESSLSAAPNRGARSLGRRYVSSGIGLSQSGDFARAMGGGLGWKVQAFEDRASRILLEDQCDEFQAADARAGQSIDVVDALQELGPVDTGRWFTNGGYGNVLGGDGGRAIRSWLTAPARERWQSG